MKFLSNPHWILVFILVASCLLTVYGKRGGGSRGGSRGGSSRGSSSRGSTSSGRTNIDRSRDRSRTDNSRNPSPPAPPPKKPDPPKPKPSVRPYVPSPKPPVAAPKPSAPEVKQPAQNPNFKEQSPNQPAQNPNFKEQSPNQPASNPNYKPQNTPNNQQPPPYSPRENPPGYSPVGQQPPHNPPAGPPPVYSPGGQQPPHAPGGAPPPYSPQGPSYNPSIGVPGANYPRQPGSQGVPNANYPRQPGMTDVRNPQQSGGSYPAPPGANYPNQGGIPGANYPRSPGYPGSNYPGQGGVPGSNYPSQGGIPGANYPRQSGGIPGANYPRQPAYPPSTLGGHVYQPQSGMPAPAYMNYGGLPTGSNMYAKPLKQKGLMGSLMSMGSSHKVGKQPKYYGSMPSPYGGGGGFGKKGGFSGKSAAMYTILPYMAARRSHSMFRPRLGFMPMFLPSLFLFSYFRPSYGYGYGHHGYRSYDRSYYDVYNSAYVGKCNRPITPKNADILCNSTRGEVDCEVKCKEGYFYPDNTTRKENRCWHVTGVWRPTKNLPDCEPFCNVTCLNGGSCSSPGVCGCLSDYRGTHCEYHFLKCDVRKLAGDTKIRWVCTHTKNETKCRIKCKDALEFESPPSEEYKCTPDGTWLPAEIPKCIEPGTASKNGTIEKE